MVNPYGPDTRGTFSFGIRLGLLFEVQAACLSAICVVGLLVYLGWTAIRTRRQRGKHALPSHLHVLFVSLLFSDLLHSIGSILNIPWIRDSGVLEGPLCTAQGIFRQMGDTGVALEILAIAVFTWGVIVRGWSSPSLKTTFVIVGLIWIFVILITLVSYGVHKAAGQVYYGNTRYWCWIRSPYSLPDGIALQYGWFWLTAAINLVLYISVAVTLLKSKRRCRNAQMPEGQRSLQKIAFQMTWYPIIYLITITPMSITRLWIFTNPEHPPPFAATALAAVLLTLSGVFNAVLFSITRPTLIPQKGHDHDPTVGGLRSIYTLEFCQRPDEDQRSSKIPPSPETPCHGEGTSKGGGTDETYV
ncbi:family A G protein-coupled receptor-like protein [Sistotremastrum niveocremeum HHB9708]|uniref:Family A G protein-coupled receptor-like protein n=1 Tax=Sistotremastrum niveocremeum HHB9708 TaxID=1314777 RepID=A0A164RNT5_9AGAM|nr:family A G protein-coupled receptor-like protein [Sistotremastrum niveocremeum HHB9708]